jgi:ribonuclease HI
VEVLVRVSPAGNAPFTIGMPRADREEPAWEHARMGRSGETTVYTDGACSGNPGPGGWAWVVPHGAWAAGGDAATTNQRMELTAALEAIRTLEGPLDVVSDSTYVVNCFRDRWWEGWLRKGWKNSQGKPVANRDLWEPLVDLVRARGDVSFRWVKGHSGDRWNDVADRLAVAAAAGGERSSGPDSAAIDTDALREDRPRARAPRAAGSSAAAPAPSDAPAGWRMVVTGHQPPELGGWDPNPVADRVRARLVEVLTGRRLDRPELHVLTGLRLGAETLAAEAAMAAGVPYTAVLPYPDPDARWSTDARRRFAELLAGAAASVVLDRKPPATTQAAAIAMTRRNAWLARHADEAVVVWDGAEARVGEMVRSLHDHLGDEVLVLRP